MVLLIRGATVCPICNRVIEANEPAVCFPAFVSNQLDPLFMFHDAAVHKACLEQHPLKSRVQKVVQALLAHCGPGKRTCVVCGTEITNPDDYVGTGYLTDDPTHPLYPFNYLEFHCSCAPNWPAARDFCKIMRHLINSGQWKAPGTEEFLLAMFEPKENNL